MRLIGGGRKLTANPDLLDLIEKGKGKRKKTPLERLEARTKKGMVGDCWKWEGAIDSGSIGYGWQILEGKKSFTHRLSFKLHKTEQLDDKGEIPEGKMVLHRCHCPTCWNPAHLYLGDAIANAADMMAAKRQRNPLKKAEVVQIVAFAKKGRSVDHLAEQFKVSAVAIRKILAGKTHAKTTGIVHVPKGPFGRPINQPMKEAA